MLTVEESMTQMTTKLSLVCAFLIFAANFGLLVESVVILSKMVFH